MPLSSRPAVVQSGTLNSIPTRWSPDDLALSAWRNTETVHPAVEQSSAEIQREAEERIRNEYDRRLEEVRATAYEQGRLDGEMAEAERLRGVVAAVEGALDAIHENEAKWQECIAENIAALSVTIARHVVGREISSNPAGIADLIRCALAEFPIDQPMRVRVNPHDLSLLSLPSPQGGDPILIAPNRDVRWMADSRIQAGGCVVEGRERIIDGRVDTALERLYRQLTCTNA